MLPTKRPGAPNRRVANSERSPPAVATITPPSVIPDATIEDAVKAERFVDPVTPKVPPRLVAPTTSKVPDPEIPPTTCSFEPSNVKFEEAPKSPLLLN